MLHTKTKTKAIARTSCYPFTNAMTQFNDSILVLSHLFCGLTFRQRNISRFETFLWFHILFFRFIDERERGTSKLTVFITLTVMIATFIQNDIHWLFCSLQQNYFQKNSLQCKGINFGFQFLFPVHFGFHEVQLHFIFPIWNVNRKTLQIHRFKFFFSVYPFHL